MNYAAIYEEDCANGIGLRTCLFVSGCTHHCEGCFNQETWDFSFGMPYTRAVEEHILSTLSPSGIDGLSVLGGEPMELVNQEALLPLLRRVKAMGKSLWVYTGYLYEELTDPGNRRCHGPYTDEILSFVDVLVDGEFVQEKKNITLRFRGSENQRIIDVAQSREAGRAILLDMG